MINAQTDRHAPLTRRFKAMYGAGALADGIVAAGFGFFLLFYLTVACGMSGTMAGLANLIALVIDAVADPAIGLASDRLRSPQGRRAPFMIWSLAPFAAGFGLLFSIPAALSGISQFIYVTVCLVVVRVSLSCFVLPLTAVGAEVSDDYGERASIVAYRLTFQNAGVLVGVVLGLGVFMAGADGLLHRAAYAPFAWTSAGAMLTAGAVAIFAVKNVRTRLHEPKAHAAGVNFIAGFAREMTELSRNRSFLVLFATVLIYFLAYAANVSLALHAARYFWRLDSGAIQLILLSATLGPVLGGPLSAFALKHIEKRSLAIAAFLTIALCMAWPPLLQLYSPIKLAPSSAAILLFLNGLALGTAIMVGGIGFQSMLADTADEHELLFGVRREGLFFSGLTLAYKAAYGLGGLIAGVALDLIAFPASQAAQGASIDGAVLTKLALISGPLPAMIAAISPLFLFGYRLTRARHRQIIAELQARNAQGASGA